MKKIAIFVSGNGEAAERIVKLFNEGNRVRTEVIVADDSAARLADRLQGEDVIFIHIPDSQWHERSEEVAQVLKDKDIRLLVLDNFALALSDEIMETTGGEMIRVSSPEQAPREVVAALEAYLRAPKEEEVATEEKPVEEEGGNKSPEHEWADALKIRYTPPKVPTTPPEVPKANDENPEPKMSEPSSFQNVVNGFAPRYEFRNEKHRHHEEPMPSTWLVWSVLVTVFCCFIPGIIAIIFSSQVSSRYYGGDIEGAKRASRMAEIWIIVSFVLGVITATFYFPFMLLGW